MGFLELLDRDLVRIPLQSSNKNEIIEELIGMLDSAGALKDRSAALQDVMKREMLGSTGLERGIAVPHAKTTTVDRMVMAVGIAPKGVDFSALDGNPSSLFFMILAPPDQSGPHIEVLADIAKVTQSDAICRMLRSAANADEVIEIFEED